MDYDPILMLLTEVEKHELNKKITVLKFKDPKDFLKDFVASESTIPKILSNVVQSYIGQLEITHTKLRILETINRFPSLQTLEITDKKLLESLGGL